MTTGYLALILHAHLPFVRQLEHEDSLAERWFFEAITESYVPLLLVLDNLIKNGIDFGLTFSITPTLTTMLAVPVLQSRDLASLDRLLERSESEVNHTRRHLQFARL